MEVRTFLRANWDRVAGVALIVAGVVMLIIGWFGISGTGLVAEQIPYLISAGLGGIAVIAVGCTAWLSADLQDEWRRLDGIERRLHELSAPAGQDGEPHTAGHRAGGGETTLEVPVVTAPAATNGAGRKVARGTAPRPAGRQRATGAT